MNNLMQSAVCALLLGLLALGFEVGNYEGVFPVNPRRDGVRIGQEMQAVVVTG